MPLACPGGFCDRVLLHARGHLLQGCGDLLNRGGLLGGTLGKLLRRAGDLRAPRSEIRGHLADLSYDLGEPGYHGVHRARENPDLVFLLEIAGLRDALQASLRHLGQHARRHGAHRYQRRDDGEDDQVLVDQAEEHHRGGA